MSNTLKLSRFVWATLRFDSIRMLRLDSIRTELCRFDWIDLKQHFQPTLHSPPQVKIREITIHEPPGRGHKLQSIRTIRVDSIELTTFSTHPQGPDQLYFHSSKSTSGKRFLSIRQNKVHESISSLSNRKYQRRIDSSWVYWTTLVISCKGEKKIQLINGNVC